MSSSKSNVVASFQFLSELPLYETEKPYELFMYTIPEGLPKSNCEYTQHDCIAVNDARGIEDDIRLQDCGFCFLRADHVPVPTMDCFESGTQVEISQYLNDTVSLLQQHLSADRILCFDWRVCHRPSAFQHTTEPNVEQIRRNGTIEDQPVEVVDDARRVALGPATRAHTGTVPTHEKPPFQSRQKQAPATFSDHTYQRLLVQWWQSSTSTTAHGAGTKGLSAQSLANPICQVSSDPERKQTRLQRDD
jgi:hypothetical protein